MNTRVQPDNPGERLAGMGNSGCELLSKNCFYFSVEGEGFAGKNYGLFGRGFGTFPIEKFDYVSQT